MHQKRPTERTQAFRQPATSALALPSILALSMMACGPPPGPTTPREEDLRAITEARAMDLMLEVMAEEGVTVAQSWAIDTGHGEPLEVDLRVVESRFGIEWVSPQDRERLGDQVPEPAPGGQLRILPGANADHEAHVLILDHTTYRYDPDRERVARGSLGVREVESRLRRDVRDFLEYARGQGAFR